MNIEYKWVSNYWNIKTYRFKTLLNSIWYTNILSFEILLGII